MSISRRLALLMLLLLTGASVGVLVIVRSQAETVAHIYDERAGVEARAAEHVIGLSGAPLVSYAADYTRWDDMVRFARTCDRAWAELNIAATQATFHADAVWVFRTNGELCYTTDPALALSLAALGLGDSPPVAGAERHGFLTMHGSIWELAAATIHPTSDLDRTTPPQGWFIAGRRFGGQTLGDLEDLLGSQVALEPPASPEQLPSADWETTIRYPLRDLGGTPVAVLTMVSAHPLIRELERVASEALVLVVFINLGTFALLSLGLSSWVVVPLRSLTRSLEGEQSDALDHVVRQGGEFGRLAELVRAFFEQHQHLTEEVAARRQTEAARRAGESTLRSFFNSAVMMMGIVEPLDDDILHLSDNVATLRFFGLPPDQTYPYRASVAGVPQELIRLWLEQYQTCVQRGGPVTFEYCHQALDGPHWLAATACPIEAPAEASVCFAYVVQDVSERKRTEAALRESEQRWQFALDAANDGLWDWNYVTGEVFFSERWQAMLGYALGEVAGHVNSWERLVHPDDMSQVMATLQTHLDGQTPFYECEHRCRARSGAWVWILDRGRVIARDEAGRPLRVIGTHTDVTARRALEAELREAELRFRSMFERHQAIMLLIEPHRGAIVDANPAAAAFYGYALADLRQMHIEAINQLTPAQVAAEQERALAEQRNYFIFPHRLARGEIRMVEVHSSPITVGAQILLFSIIHDISARVRMEVAEREQRTLAEALRDTALALTSTLNVDAVLDCILEHVGPVVPHDAVAILLLDVDGDSIAVTRRRGDPAYDPADAAGARFSLARMPILSQMARTGQPVVIATTQTDPTWVDAAASSWVMAYAGAPIRIRQRTVGFLTVESATPGFFTPEHAERLQTLANQAAIAIEHARLYAEVEALAVADPLTGVANRRGLFQIGVREVERALRNHTSLALIMLDLDHFKQINDTYGHPMGDRVLLAVVTCCRSIVRAIDVVARYGGEEFVLLIPDTDMGEAAVVAERLRQAIALLVVPEAVEQHGFSPPIQVTVSLGVGALTTDTPTLEALIERADRALYAAKHAGRNQVCCAEPGELAPPHPSSPTVT